MPQVIIYPNETNNISLIQPCLDCGISIEEIARKDTPAGKPYLIIDASEVPEDHTFFNAFEADFSAPHGYGIGSEAWFAEQATKEQV